MLFLFGGHLDGLPLYIGNVYTRCSNWIVNYPCIVSSVGYLALN